MNFRKKERVFPVVLKGTYSIVDTEELKYTIQREVTRQLSDADITMTVKSDFQAVIEMLEDMKFSSFWESMLQDELVRYASSIEELKEALEMGDVNVLKEINIALKKSNMIKATPDIKQWLTEVMNEIRKQNVADYLMIFWDEFTSLLEVTERRSILNCIQDIAELSKAPRKDDKDKFIGVYVFLITHKSMEATDSYKELKEDEKTMAKARFLGLKYDMQDVTTYHILSNALKISDNAKYAEIVNDRIIGQIEVKQALDEIVAPMDKSAQTRIVTTIHSSKGLQYKQVIINSENYIWRGTMNNPEVHYVAITRPEEKLLVLFKQKRENAKIYIDILCKRVQNIAIDGVQQHINDVIEIVKI